MTNKGKFIACILALILGAGVAFLSWRAAPVILEEQRETDKRIADIRERFRQENERTEIIMQETKRKVVVERERTVNAVRVLPVDGVVSALNAELGLWRLEERTARLGDS